MPILFFVRESSTSLVRLSICSCRVSALEEEEFVLSGREEEEEEEEAEEEEEEEPVLADGCECGSSTVMSSSDVAEEAIEVLEEEEEDLERFLDVGTLDKKSPRVTLKDKTRPLITLEC